MKQQIKKCKLSKVRPNPSKPQLTCIFDSYHSWCLHAASGFQVQILDKKYLSEWINEIQANSNKQKKKISKKSVQRNKLTS